MIGYKLLFYYQIRVAESFMQERIQTIDESDESLFTLKIPIRLPYHTDWKDFESVEGEISYNNTTYKYVKRKVLRDTLILLCVNYQEKSLIRKNQDDYFKRVNDLTADNSKKQVLKQTKDDYYQELRTLFASVYPISITLFHCFNHNIKTSAYIPSIDVPPRCLG